MTRASKRFQKQTSALEGTCPMTYECTFDEGGSTPEQDTHDYLCSPTTTGLPKPTNASRTSTTAGDKATQPAARTAKPAAMLSRPAKLTRTSTPPRTSTPTPTRTSTSMPTPPRTSTPTSTRTKTLGQRLQHERHTDTHMTTDIARLTYDENYFAPHDPIKGRPYNVARNPIVITNLHQQKGCSSLA
ncbi:hypothetical protein B0T20DRAFT_392433 [Sordaria brevicollis]|uniref:Uncharacterized protein n=1 Tax=Sordaria brevicollis TaxID=83679 RepID=A0AAE0PGH5_SORBR|nr:hypothetical protein B0T20DRAFT_392433 [Sordaria brevicollis]